MCKYVILVAVFAIVAPYLSNAQNFLSDVNDDKTYLRISGSGATFDSADSTNAIFHKKDDRQAKINLSFDYILIGGNGSSLITEEKTNIYDLLNDESSTGGFVGIKFSNLFFDLDLEYFRPFIGQAHFTNNTKINDFESTHKESYSQLGFVYFLWFFGFGYARSSNVLDYDERSTGINTITARFEYASDSKFVGLLFEDGKGIDSRVLITEQTDPVIRGSTIDKGGSRKYSQKVLITFPGLGDILAAGVGLSLSLDEKIQEVGQLTSQTKHEEVEFGLAISRSFRINLIQGKTRVKEDFINTLGNLDTTVSDFDTYGVGFLVSLD